MPDDAILEDGDIGRTAADVDEHYAGFLLFLSQNRFRGGQRLQKEALRREAGTLYTLVDVFAAVTCPVMMWQFASNAHPTFR